MPGYILSPRAQRSLTQISSYTLDNYGRGQQKKYLSMLRDRMRKAAKEPQQGRERPDIKSGYFSIQAGKHNIYYRITDARVEIIDVLHQSMEPRLRL
ncbi:MAG: type II toxin-antitoxin system RelE/ParE family toxin [Pseudomonadota bacterium]